MKRTRNLQRWLLCTIAALSLSATGVNCWADPALPTLFSDHMVLQQGRKIHIWGTADPGEKITADLAGREATGTADARGHWSADLPALSAGGPFTLVVRGKKEIVIKDVMIGEVWIASGQSNMTFPLDGAEGSAAEVPQANYPQIRLFIVPKKIALSPQENTPPSHWEICTPDTAQRFSAVAYFFAREISRKRGVPVGIVESAWPGTTIEEWISPEILQADPDLKPILDEASNHMTSVERTFAEKSLPFELEVDDFELMPAAPNSTGKVLANFDDRTSNLTTGGSFYAWSEATDTVFELAAPGHGTRGFSARIAGQLDGTHESILTANYKMDGSAVDLTVYAGIRFWIRGNGSFRFRSKQPTIADYDDYATQVLKASNEWQPITIWFRDLRQEG